MENILHLGVIFLWLLEYAKQMKNLIAYFIV